MTAVRYAARTLLATPVVTSAAVLSLALGIGANTALFTLVNTLVLKSLPVHQPDRLALLGEAGTEGISWTNPIWEAFRDRQAFDGAFAWGDTRFNLASGGETRFVNGTYASGRFFAVLGVDAMLGRTFTEADDKRGGGEAGPVAVIGYGFWQRHFGGSADAIGKPLTLDGVPFTVIGVTPPEFTGLEVGTAADVIVPLCTEAAVRGAESSLDKRSYWWLDVMVRLEAGQTLESGTRAARALQAQVREATLPTDWPAKHLAEYLDKPFTLEPASGGTSSLRSRYQRPLVTLIVVVSLMLLIACANIANLLLARATARRHELAVRLALGASRFRLGRQLLTESLLLAGSGTVLGLALAYVGSRLLVRLISTQTRVVTLDLSLDWRVLLFTIGVTAATAILFGVAPAFRAAQVEPQRALADRGRAIIASTGIGLGGALVVVQVALSLVLVVAGGLFVRTFTGLVRLDPGFVRDPLLVVAVDGTRVPQSARPSLFEQVREAASGVPGVASAAASVVTPVSGMTWQYSVEVPDGPPKSERDGGTFVNLVSPGWFGTYGIRLVEGRDFTTDDGPGAPGVAIVNETFVRRFLGGIKRPIGRVIRQAYAPVGKTRQSWTIVGVVTDAVYRSLRDPVPPTMYVALAQAENASPFVRLTVRSGGPRPASLVRAVAHAVGRVAPQLPLTFRPLADQVNASLLQERLIATIAGFFGSLGLLLAALGLYGLASYSVTRRRAEIGVRMALGAAPVAAVRSLLARLALLVAAGTAAGAAASWWAARFVDKLLFRVAGHDAANLAGSIALLVAVAIVAAWIPAARAARINPVEVLRE
jgi:predicted permease